MSDAEKLEIIEKIAREAFSEKWYEVPRHTVDAHRTQALANIYALFIYDGLATVAAPAAVTTPIPSDTKPDTDDGQMTFDEILEQCYIEEGGTHER